MTKKMTPIKLDAYKPLRDIVCEAMRQAMVDGVFHPGERLMEIQLAEDLGVSRTPVREAIRKLELEGFVVIIPRRGTYVADISIRDINEVYEIRIALDVLAAGLAAARISSEDFLKLNDYLRKIEECIENNDTDKLVELDVAFHDVLYHASNNKRLVGIISNLREQMTRIRTRSMNYRDRRHETFQEHKKLVAAIADKNIEEAKRIAREHLENAERTLLMSIKENSVAEKNTKKKKKDSKPCWTQ